MTDDVKFNWMVGITALLLVALFAVMGYRGVQHGRCLQHGYPAVELTWNFETYCLKRVDQTDTVVPLDALP